MVLTGAVESQLCLKPCRAAWLERTHQMAAIHDNGGAGHQLRGIGCEQHERAVQMLRLADAPLRNAFDEVASGLGLEEVAIEIGLDIAWRECIHPNVVACKLERHRLGQLDQTRLGSSVG